MKKQLKKDDNPLLIPFGKAVRVGNYKVWRGNYTLASGKEKTQIECVHVSSLDGAWMVRIPSTGAMFSTIMNSYATTDTTIRDNFLGMLFANFLNITTIPSEALHDAFFFLTEMMSYPYMLLPEKEMEKRMKDGLKRAGFEKSKAKEHIAKMMDYRRQLYELIERKKASYLEDYESQQDAMWASEDKEQEELHHDELAEQAIEIVNDNNEK